jgi:hypothetical protein
MRNLVKIRESMLKGVARPSAGLFAMLMIFGSVAVMSAPERECRFADILVSHGPSPQVSAGAAAVFDWLVGDWEADVYDYGPGGSKRVSKGEWHFSWILEGRAVQDIWIVPKRSDRNATAPSDNNRYGTTIRIYDPKLDAWRVFWFNPVTQDRTELIGRRVGNTVVQQSVGQDGSFIRWIFENIKPNSFTWRGEFSTDGGKTWKLDAEFLARRIEANKH